MRLKTKRLAAFLLALPLLLGAVSVADGFYKSVDAEISGISEYKAIRLTPEIYASSSADLYDILIISDGKVLPYFQNSFESDISVSAESYAMAPADSYLKETAQFLDYKVANLPNHDIIATSVNISTNEQFVKSAVLYGSYDGANWEKITEDNIYNVNSSSHLSISLGYGEKFTWYRFELEGNQQPVSFDAVWLEYSTESVRTQAFAEALSPQFTVEEDGKDTVISINGVKNLPIQDITFETDSIFNRTVSAGRSTETLYNLIFGNTTYKNLTLPMNGYKPRSDNLEVRIYNKDDSPINIKSVNLSYFAADLVFKTPESESITLYFGNNTITSPPQYDIESYKSYVIAEGYDMLPLADVKTIIVQEEETEPADYTLLFNIIIAAASVILAGLIIVMMRKPKKKD